MSNELANKPSSSSEEIDLIELFNRMGRSMRKGVLWIADRVKDFIILLIRKSLWIIGFGIVGLVFGYSIFKNTPRFYSSEMVAISNALDNSYIISSINQLDNVFKSGNYSYAATYLEMEENDAKQIKSINAYYGIDVNGDSITDYVDYQRQFIPTSDTLIRRLTTFFYVKLEVYSESVFAQARDGIIKYFNKNKFIIENNNLRVAQTEELIQSMDDEISKLDSMQRIQYFEIPRSQKTAVSQMVIVNDNNSKLFHEQLLKLKKERQKARKALLLSKEPITIVQDFAPLSKVENPVTRYLIRWGAIFALLGFATAMLWQYRRKIYSLIKEKRY